MGHRHMFNAPQIFENDTDMGWSHGEQPYMPMARVGAPESSSNMHPVDGLTIHGGHFPSQWTPAPRATIYSSSIHNHNAELPHYQPLAPGPSRDPYLHQSAAGNFQMFQDNYPHRASSSNLGEQAAPGLDGGFYDQTPGISRGAYKRKSPGVPCIGDRGSTSRYYDVGSSSGIHLPSDPWQEKQNVESFHAPLEYPSTYGANNLSVGGEGTFRNVRSRAAVDMEANVARTHFTSNPLHHSFPCPSSDQSNPMDVWVQSSNGATREWNHNLMPNAGSGVAYGSVSDSSFFSHDPSTQSIPSHPSGSLELGVCSNEVTTNRNHVPQNVHSNLNQPARGVRSSYGQRSVPTFRASSSAFRPIMPSDEGLPVVADSYPSRHARAFSTVRLRNMERNGRTLTTSDRYRSSTEEASLRDRFAQEAFMVADHPAFYGSRFDQHRDMRLDIDNMGYEELLELGERIGSVNTGLSDNLISKCMTESIYCSSDLLQDEGTCVICLEEYKNMDDVGSLKVCRHDFHVGCIRKWLSMKNSCPICKASALDDNVQEQ